MEECKENEPQKMDVSNTSYEETVLALPEQLQILPDNILSVFKDYESGLLDPVSSEELQKILDNWFGKKHVVESEHEQPSNDPNGRFTSWDGKRQRINVDV